MRFSHTSLILTQVEKGSLRFATPCFAVTYFAVTCLAKPRLFSLMSRVLMSPVLNGATKISALIFGALAFGVSPSANGVSLLLPAVQASREAAVVQYPILLQASSSGESIAVGSTIRGIFQLDPYIRQDVVAVHSLVDLDPSADVSAVDGLLTLSVTFDDTYSIGDVGLAMAFIDLGPIDRDTILIAQQITLIEQNQQGSQQISLDLPSPGVITVIPEPAIGAVALVAGAGLMRRRK